MNTALVAVLYGLGGAIGWGASNFFAAKATREKNVVLTVFTSQLFLFLAMSLIVLVLRPEFVISAGLVLFLALNYLVFTIGLFISYKAFAIGPISITSPIVGSNALVVVAVSVLIFNQVLALSQWVGIAALFLGLFIASYEKRREKKDPGASGIMLAFIALFLIGGGIAGFVYAIGQVGWELTVLLGYFFPAFWSGLYLAYKRELEVPHISKSLFGLVAFQILGTISVSVGVEKSLSALVIPVSSVSPMVTSLLGLVLFKEKVIQYKLIGVGIIILGLVFISI